MPNDLDGSLPPLPTASHLIAWSIVLLAGSGVAGLAFRGSWGGGLALAVATLALSGFASGIVLCFVDPETRRALAARRAAEEEGKRAAATEAEEREDLDRVIGRAVAEIQAAADPAAATTAVERPRPRRRRNTGPRTIRSKVVGVTFRNDDGTDRQATIARHCRAGTPLRLAPEPGNPHDPFAVAVLAFGVQIGYLRSGLAEEVLGFLEAGMTARVEVVEVTGGGRRESLGVNIRIDLA